MKKLTFIILSLILGLFYTVSQVQAQDQERDMTFKTMPAMYAANEEWLTFACELPDGQVNIGSTKAVEMYYYSMYGLGNLLFRSGMGVHIVHNPLFTKHVKEDKGMPWYNEPMGNKMFFQHKVSQFVARTGAKHADAQFPPKGVHPIYLEFSSGNPSFMAAPELDDFNTLRWNPEQMDKTMNPGAWGQSMMKQVLWARDFFTNHKQIDGITYLGNAADDKGNGFRGAGLIAMSITKSFALKEQLAYNPKTDQLGSVDPANYNPANGPIYYPHKYEVEFKEMKGGMPPMPAKFKVTDKRSHLFDVASLLWAESEFYFFTDPKVKDDYDMVFGDPMWNPKKMSEAQMEQAFKNGKTIFPATPHKLSMGITAVNFKNMMGLHFNGKAGTLVDSWHPESKQGNYITTANAGMAIIALANTHHHLHDVAPLKNGSKKILTAQANFLLNQQENDGSFANGYKLKKGKVKADKSDETLLAQSYAIRGLLEAYHATKDEKYKKAALKTYQFMEDELWSDDAEVYRAHVGAKKSTYEGLNFGATIGALREVAIVHEGSERRAIVSKLDKFFEQVAQKNGLQLSEIGRTGEPVPPLAQRKEMQQKMKTMMKNNPEKAKQMQMNMADGDNDGVPKPVFVKGTKYGAAPVQASSVTIDTK